MLTVYVVWPKRDFNLKRFVGVFDGGKLEVGQRLLTEIWHHSLYKNNTQKNQTQASIPWTSFIHSFIF